MAARSATSVSRLCSSSRCGTPSLPVQLAGSWNHSTTPLIMRVAALPGPRREHALHRDEEQVEDDREQHTERTGDQDLRLEVALLPGDQEVPESAVVEDRADGRQRHRRHRGHADPGHDRGQGQRELDPEQQPRARRTPCRWPTRARRRARPAARRGRCAPGSSASRAPGRGRPSPGRGRSRERAARTVRARGSCRSPSWCRSPRPRAFGSVWRAGPAETQARAPAAPRRRRCRGAGGAPRPGRRRGW